jgi:two-component system sensor histidine kinase VicK
LATALAQASQAKTDFIADVSHELRTPLTVLRGNAEVGLALEGDCVHKPMLEEILDESARMARMLEDLLVLARSAAATLPLTVEPTRVAPCLAELAARAEMVARQRGISLRVELAGEGTVSIDRARIEQAVLNLVDNAGKYSQSSEPVTLRATTAAGELRVEVVDRGAGIPSEDLPHVFDRFYRVDKVRSRKLGGAGLGLSIVKMIVEAHGGRVGAASRLGEGTRFWLCLPLEAAEEPAGALAVAARGQADR